MPHLRKRHAEPLLRKLLAFSPIVGVMGHRQVGKTTLLEKVAEGYTTFDVRRERERADIDPQAFISGASRAPFAIDEAQLVPDLFPALKESVRINKKPGQFLLSGSVRFTARKAIRESLTGRIVNLELLPMTQAEMDGRQPNAILSRALEARSLVTIKGLIGRREEPASVDLIARYLKTGGLPGACFVRADSLRAQKFESQLETVLDRDLRLLVETRLPFRTLRNVLATLALLQGQPLEIRELSRRTRVSAPTLRNLLDAFEAMFLIRRLETRGTEVRPVVFFEDQGEASHLAGRPVDSLTDLTRFLFSHLRSPLLLEAGGNTFFFQYRTRGGAYVPLCVERGARGFLGIIPILEENPGRQALASAASFTRKYVGAKVLFVHPYQSSAVLSDDLAVLPATSLA